MSPWLGHWENCVTADIASSNDVVVEYLRNKFSKKNGCIF